MATEAATKPSLTLKRHLKASPAKVFAAWTDPEKVKRWMGPGEIKALRAESDLRVGGRYRWVMKAPDGEEHDVSGIYREIVANEKLVFTWAWKSTPERESLVTVLLKPDGGGTLLTVTHEQFFDEDTRDRHQHGWNGALDIARHQFVPVECAVLSGHGVLLFLQFWSREITSRGQQLLHLVEGAVPAALVAVARVFVEELFVGHSQ